MVSDQHIAFTRYKRVKMSFSPLKFSFSFLFIYLFFNYFASYLISNFFNRDSSLLSAFFADHVISLPLLVWIAPLIIQPYYTCSVPR